MTSVHKFDDFHHTKAGLLIFGVIELCFSYAFAAWAIDSGRLLAYFLAILFLIGGLQNFVKLILKVVHRG